jgi:hypothetical protein
MRIVYYTLGNSVTGSTRLRVLVPAQYLRTSGCEVILNPTRPVPADVAVFQKRADMPGLMRQYRTNGARVVMDICDFGKFPAELADVTVVSVPYLKRWYKDALVIPDALDVNESSKPKRRHEDMLRSVVWFGGPENIVQASNVAVACQRIRLPLTVISNHKSKYATKLAGAQYRQWTLGQIDRMLPQYDLAVCPFLLDGPKFRSLEYLSCKSPNRPLKAWALGLPVAGSPIPSYRQCGVQHMATSIDEWVALLNGLRMVELREEDAARGMMIADNYRTEVIGRMWLELFRNLCSREDTTDVPVDLLT